MSDETRDAQLEQLRRVWAALGHDDPLWAVLSHADKRGGRWEPEAFFATGQVEVDQQLTGMGAWNVPARRRIALDFGSGAGRLTRALARHFDQVVGVDVSASMVDCARRLNADLANATFIENRSTRLEGIADQSIDLVYSNMTLQHMPANLALGYVGEFLRVLAPGGVAVFQFVAGTDASWRGRLYAMLPNRWLNPLRRILWRRSQVFEMHILEEADLQAMIEGDARFRLLAATEDGAAGPGWAGRRWYVARAWV
jgi:SAM-dependent methyltransferase